MTKLDEELIKFSSFLENNKFIQNRQLQTTKFWSNNKEKFPLLSKLAAILLNISSSSAFIERFFSIAGIICSKRRGNMKNDLIISRSLLKSNINTLNQLRIEEKPKN